MSEDFVKKKRGRPVGGSRPKDKHLHIRLDGDESDRLDYICRLTGKTRTEVYKDMFNMYESWKKVQLENESPAADYDYDDYYEEETDDDVL